MVSILVPSNWRHQQDFPNTHRHISSRHVITTFTIVVFIFYTSVHTLCYVGGHPLLVVIYRRGNVGDVGLWVIRGSARVAAYRRAQEPFILS